VLQSRRLTLAFGKSPHTDPGSVRGKASIEHRECRIRAFLEANRARREAQVVRKARHDTRLWSLEADFSFTMCGVCTALMARHPTTCTPVSDENGTQHSSCSSWPALFPELFTDELLDVFRTAIGAEGYLRSPRSSRSCLRSGCFDALLLKFTTLSRSRYRCTHSNQGS
jgi:hypothetical protein